MVKNKLRVAPTGEVLYRDGTFEVPISLGIERQGRIVRWEKRTMLLSEYQVTTIVRGAKSALNSARASIENRLARLKEAAE